MIPTLSNGATPAEIYMDDKYELISSEIDTLAILSPRFFVSLTEMLQYRTAFYDLLAKVLVREILKLSRFAVKSAEQVVISVDLATRFLQLMERVKNGKTLAV